MKALSAAELLDAWEACQALPSPQRSLALLLAALPEVSVQELAHEPVGQRDGRLLTLREQVFGRQVAALATCQKCGLQVDLAFATTDIRAPEAAPDATAVVQVDGYRAVVRPINSFDLMELQAADGLTITANASDSECGSGGGSRSEAVPMSDRMSERIPECSLRRPKVRRQDAKFCWRSP